MCVVPFVLLVLYVCVLSLSRAHPRYAGIRVKMGPAPLRTRESVCERTEAGVELTVSPQLDTKTSRRLQVSWWVPQVQSADVIALYLTDPAVNLTAPVYTVPPTTSTGWSDTPLRETYLNYRHVFTSVCLGYWVVYWRGRDKITSSCLRTNPSWMSDHREDLGRLRLTELFIPGTHDSAAYSVTYQPREESRYDKYVFTQEESVLSQLVHGVRYLDLRLGYHKNDGGFFSHHGFAKLRHFQGVIDDLIVFLENSKDIVIIDLHHFPVGFKSEEIHKELVRYLEKELSEYMATPALGWRATLEDVWRTGKQLIVSYNNKAIVSKGTHKLWYPVSQRWGDVRTVEGLREYLRSVMRRQPLEAWAAMAELTPDKWAVLLDTQGGLRAMATRTNMQVTDWFRHDWALYCNIVAVDFIRSSGIISIAIDSNLRKIFNLCM